MAGRGTTRYMQENSEFEQDSRGIIARAIDERMSSDSSGERAVLDDLRARGMSAKQVIDEINDQLGYDSEVDPKHVTDWRRGRSLVPLRLWQVLGIVLWDDPTRIARLARALPDEADNLAETLALHHSLDRLRHQHADLAEEIAASPSQATARLVEAIGRAELHGEWRMAVSPAFEGPAGYTMHVADRIDFCRADGTIPKKEDLEMDLQEEFGILNVQPSPSTPGRWASPSTDMDADPYLRYSIGFTASSFPPPIALPYKNVRSISVVSAEAILWPSDVGAMLARLLGFGFTSTESIARSNYGFGYREQMTAQMTLVHRQLLAQPWRRYVWSHYTARHPDAEVADLLPMPDQVPPGHLSILLKPSEISPGEEGFYEQLDNRVNAIRGNDGMAMSFHLPVLDRTAGAQREEKWTRTFKAAFALRKSLCVDNIFNARDYEFARSQLAVRRDHNVYAALARWDEREQ